MNPYICPPWCYSFCFPHIRCARVCGSVFGGGGLVGSRSPPHGPLMLSPTGGRRIAQGVHPLHSRRLERRQREEAAGSRGPSSPHREGWTRGVERGGGKSKHLSLNVEFSDICFCVFLYAFFDNFYMVLCEFSQILSNTSNAFLFPRYFFCG